MARIRSIKPDFFTSDTVSELSMRARLTWIGLWTYCDDFGRGRHNVKLIKAAVWPLDDVSLVQIEKDISDLLGVGVLSRYEVDGKAYLAVTNWKEHQKVSHPTDSKIPDPPGGYSGPPPAGGETPEDYGDYTEDSGENPEESGADRDMSGAAPSLARVREEQGTGNREQGTGKKKLARAAPEQRDLFDVFWTVYSKRVDKRTAERAWRAAIKRGAVGEVIIAAAHQYATAKIGTDPKYIKNPATWLNAAAYDNEPEPVVPYLSPSDRNIFDIQSLKARFPDPGSEDIWQRQLPGGSA